MDWTTPLLGFAVGLLVGMTGIGAAARMAPLLVLVRLPLWNAAA